MTDVSSVKAHADSQPASVALFGAPPPPAVTNGSPALDGTIEEEESSTIKCICGFSDDDGNTVLCEKCDTWQHIVCYYESAHHVPDVHECTDCLPRPVDTKRAAEKQRLRREMYSIGERKGRPKTTAKSHKKRVKDPLGSVQPNGWAVHSNNDLHYPSERKSGSPRDQPPPNKRPKTSHRASGSVNMISQAPALAPASRKRAGSTMLNGHSPVKSPTDPEGPIEEFSLEFMNLYRQPEPPSTDSNSYTDIRVANDISLWLNDRDALIEATGGRGPGEVFERIESTIEDMEASSAPAITKQTEVDPAIKAHGLNPQWHFLTVETRVPAGGFVGELKGRIGRKQDYFSEPSNRWEFLRHPEPFVFFPPHLPIYIDTRHEGTILRYARRSCNPNMIMKILTQGPETGYHFCFVAMREIEPGEELTVGWDINAEVRQQLLKAVNNGDIKKEGFKKIQPWVACVLANFGGCACDNSAGYECLLERARRNNSTYAEPAPPPKSTKGRKSKKSQVSPLSTGHATNSRAGSEAFHREVVDDDNMDARSTSGSHKSSSRDITPATHFSVDGDLKMSDRERRKLQQQERLFEQLEYDEQHKGKRGKRNSAGSTLNTPSLSSSRQLGHSEISPSGRHPREHSHGVARKTSGGSARANGKVIHRPKPVYADASTQTEDDKASAASSTPPVKARVMRPPVSFKRRLLQQAQEEKLQRERIRSASVKMEVKSPALKDVSSTKPSPVPPPAPLEEPTAMDITTEPAVDIAVKESSVKEPTPSKEPTPPPSEDVEMQDADEPVTSRPPSPKLEEEMPDALDPEPAASANSHAPTQLPPPPWPTITSPTVSDSSAPVALPTSASPSEPSEKPVDLHVEMPPKPDLTNPTASTNSVVTPGSVSSVVITGAAAQSPVNAGSAPSPFSPAVTNAVNPGPARKKLSLSDYTSRRAKMAQTQSTGPNGASEKHQPIVSPTLSNASLPTQASPPGKGSEPSLSAVPEEATVTQPTTSTST